MSEAVKRTMSSSQEQALASWINELNQIRLNELVQSLVECDSNFEDAMAELAELKEFIGNPAHILGSQLTKHGEIAEHVQVNFSNARAAMEGLEKEYTFEGVGRTAPEDYLKAGQEIQSKFCVGAKNTLDAVQRHIETYPNFVKNGGSYDIPKDQYEKLIDVINRSKSDPSSVSKSEWSLLRAVEKFEEETGLTVEENINPSVVDYSEVQQGKIVETINNEEENLKQEDQEKRKEAYEASKPSIKEGLKATAISAAIEGGMAFCLSVAEKRKSGKRLSEFSEEDWKDIGLDTGKGALQGGIRGGAVYATTNFTATPAAVASAYVTAAFGIANQVKALQNGNISQEDFVINCETVCLDVTVSAIASLAGQVLIPIPVLGAVIGNVAGEFVYELCKKYGSVKEQKLITGYRSEMEELNKQLTMQYINFVIEIKTAFRRFNSLEKLAFDADINKAFTNSVMLAEEIGVAESHILHDISDIDAFFQN